MKCKIMGCEKGVYVKSSDLCSKHYNRLITTGTTDDGPKARASDKERLKRYFKEESKEECWLWTGAKTGFGYGKFTYGGKGGKQTNAHRAVWELYNGKVPKDKQLNHKCANRHCVNPNHLYLGTQKENMQDRSKDGNAYHWERPKGQGHGNSKFTDEQARYIKTGDRTDRDLAAEYNVTPECIHYIRHKGWKHICVN